MDNFWNGSNARNAYIHYNMYKESTKGQDFYDDEDDLDDEVDLDDALDNDLDDDYAGLDDITEEFCDDSEEFEDDPIYFNASFDDHKEDIKETKISEVNVESKDSKVSMQLSIDGPKMDFTLLDKDREYIDLKLKEYMLNMGKWLLDYLNELKVEYQTKYIYCGIYIEEYDKVFSYRDNGLNVKVGDKVVVAFGKDNALLIGRVVSVGEYLSSYVPYPLEKTRTIVKKM